MTKQDGVQREIDTSHARMLECVAHNDRELTHDLLAYILDHAKPETLKKVEAIDPYMFGAIRAGHSLAK